MDNPGLYNLGDVALAAINAATAATVVTSQPDSQGVTQPYRDGLEGMLSATLQANFTYGSSGGTSIKVIWEISNDQGTTWCEVCRMALATASEENIVNLSALTPKTTPYTPAALSDDSCVDGIIGTWWRARILTVGTYVGNAALSLRLIAR
jgi:hypothetical protein